MMHNQDLNRVCMARRKHRGESPFLTLTKADKERARKLFWGSIAVEATLWLAWEVYWSRKANIEPKQQQGKLSQKDEVRIQQAS